MNVQNTELQRQNEAYRAVRARLWGKGTDEVKPAPLALKEPARKLVQLDYHVWLYRLYLVHYPPNLSTSATFHIEPADEYRPYEAHVKFETSPIRQTMKDITLDVLRDFPDVTLEILRSERKDNAVSMPRGLAMYEIRKRQPWRSFPEIGRFFNRNHATVIHAFLKWGSAIDNDEESEARYERRKATNREYHAKLRAAQQNAESQS